MINSEKEEVVLFQIGYNHWLSNGKNFLLELEAKFNVDVVWYLASNTGWQEGFVLIIGLVASVIEIAEYIKKRLKDKSKGEPDRQVTAWVVINDEKIILNGLTKDEISKLFIEALEGDNYREYIEDRRKKKDMK